MTRASRARAGRCALALSSAWILWHDLGVYRAAEPTRLGGPTYQVSSHATREECESEQGAAMVREARSRVGPRTDGLVDGIKVWDPDRRHYTTLRYVCRPAEAGPVRFQ